MKKGMLIPLIIVGAVMLLAVGTSFYTEYLWFQSLGVTQVFMKPVLYNLAVKAVFFVLAFGFLLANFLPLVDKVRIKHLEVVGHKQPALTRLHAVFVALGVSMLWVLVLPSIWERVLLFLNSSPVGQVDPVLGWDIGFYLFQYPLLSYLSGATISLLFFAFVPAILAYVVSGNIGVYAGKLRVDLKARAHLSVLLALFLLWFAATRFLAMADLTNSSAGVFFGAGATDVSVRLPLIRIQQIVAIGLGLLVVANIWLRKRAIVLAVPVVLVFITAATGIAAGVYQGFVVKPNEEVRELPYIGYHIEATRDAYGLANLEQRQYPLVPPETVDRGAISERETTINNIRLLDYRPLKQHYLQNQSLRLYYTFNDIDIDRYRIGDEYHQVMLAVRELDSSALPQKTPINQHFRYTHGYGVVMSPVNAVTSSGHPTYFFRNIPVSSTIDLALTRPEIYFGELTNDFVVVNTKGKEYGYLEDDGGDGTTVVDYQGDDGVELTFMRRVLFALKYQKSILLLSDEITPDSKILFHRNIQERINRIAPFITTDYDPYPVVADGRVFWIVDGYTTSSNYPYSEPTGDYNYIRNSVKIVVDAYNGDVSFYRFADDPIIQAWQGVFPGLIQERDQFPSYLEDHIRYPEDFFSIQADILRRYHVSNASMFYHGSDVLEVPVEKYGNREVMVEPYYVTMQLPHGDEAEFVLMLPFTPLQRNNMTAWLGAGNDGDSYGELYLYHFPQGQHVEGPSQIEAAIDQHPDISSQLTLWSQGGSTVVRGNLLVIPINGSILYVEPLYLVSETRSVPEMRQVIVYYQGELAMESTLDRALDVIFGLVQDPPSIVDPEDPDAPPISGDVLELSQKIGEAYTRMEKASRNGDWAEYGRQLEELGRLIERLEQKLADLED